MKVIFTFERKFFSFLEKRFDYIFFAVGLILALLTRIALMEYKSNDYENFLKPWYEYIKSHGGFAALKDSFSDYTPPYIYILAFLTYLPIPSLYGIKIVSILFDFGAAAVTYMIVRQRYQRRTVPCLSFFAVLFAPTVIFNSALWAQCDIIYTAFAVLSLYFLIKEKNIPAFILYGISLSFKLQAIFLFPLYFILYLKRRANLLEFFLIPLMYIVAIIPNALIGRPFSDLLLIYANQEGSYEYLTLNAPNLYQWISNDYYDIFNPAGIALAASVVLAFSYVCYKGKTPLGSGLIIKIALLSSLLVPYFLPQMHERYFFMADIISIIYAFYFGKHYLVPAIVCLISFFSYTPYLFGITVINMKILALILLGLIFFLIMDLTKDLFPKAAQL